MSVSWEVREGDARTGLREMPSESVQCCVTSPPYFGLRDYGTGEWEGGDSTCAHQPRRWDGPKQTQGAMSGHSARTNRLDRERCTCGALRTDRQIGLEATPDEFVAALVAVFAEVRRVLRDDGTLWLNLGDSYTAGAGSRNGQNGSGLKRNVVDEAERQRCLEENKVYRAQPLAGINTGVKPKDLLGIPWMVAFALRADGWYLRSDIIWAKPNPMPESVTDRPTKAHEYLFLLSKSPRYFYDADAIREPSEYPDDNRKARQKQSDYDDQMGELARARAVINPLNATTYPQRNKRSVWTVATQPFAGAHFATFPPKLIEPCILAGCPEGGTVLDPFAGSGTTGMVALRHNRSFVGIELNAAYAALARDRIVSDAPLLNSHSEIAA